MKDESVTVKAGETEETEETGKAGKQAEAKAASFACAIAGYGDGARLEKAEETFRSHACGLFAAVEG